ncbi:MAG TPA: UDP-N-acetylglucosamine 2-epimerase (non-hydrolyzing) [Thermodesulfobacteriota bacterium]|nr:UDP-N-acetylglucosamine 2-epimerase (non-hydrolyzing) [Thermodesulfobacteriota bacterium]
MKIVTVVGARPQFIKAAAVSRGIQAWNRKGNRIHEILVHTGQHYDASMDKVFFEELELPRPHYHLGVGSGAHGRQTGIMLERIEAVLEKEKPKWVLVYGDTNSTLAGALAAAKLKIPIAHVEAGLRSYNRKMPEEINRLLTDHLSTLLFCPTNQAVKNLAREGIKDDRRRVVKKVGDVMFDSILYYSRIAEKRSTILKRLDLLTPNSGRNADLPSLRPCTERFQAVPYYLVTLHRAENTDDPKRLRSILKALNEIGRTVSIILPLHPRTKKMMKVHRLLSERRRLRQIEPVSYLDMLQLEKHAKAILTDSGGVQKEAYWFRVPCYTLRDETEWVETVASGWNVLVGSEGRRIVKEVGRWERRRGYLKGNGAFGDGKASQKILQLLTRQMGDLG